MPGKNRFELIGASHHDMAGNGRVYERGDIVVSDLELDKMFKNKFRRLSDKAKGEDGEKVQLRKAKKSERLVDTSPEAARLRKKARRRGEAVVQPRSDDGELDDDEVIAEDLKNYEGDEDPGEELPETEIEDEDNEGVDEETGEEADDSGPEGDDEEGDAEEGFNQEDEEEAPAPKKKMKSRPPQEKKAAKAGGKAKKFKSR